MKYTKLFITSFIMLCSLVALAQRPKLQPSAEAQQRMKDKAEYSQIKRLILALPEFTAEKKKIPSILAANRGLAVKVLPTIDSVEGDTSTTKTITGYITQIVGDNATNVYEVTYDRKEQKLTSVKRTGEQQEPELAPKQNANKAKANTKPKQQKEEEEEEEDAEETTHPKSTKPTKDKDEE